MFKKVNRLVIITSIIIVILGIIAIIMSKAKVEINSKSFEQININYSKTESNTWDVSKSEDESVIATLSDDGILTISGTGEMRDWSYYDTTDWHGIKDDVKSVIIEQGITNIGNNAFVSCTSLTSIEIPEGVTSIGYSAFAVCENLTSIEIPESVTKIGNSVFSYCTNLTNIEIPNSVTSIDARAFYKCTSLTSIEIPEGVKSIAGWAFERCDDLTSINVNENNKNYKDDNGVLYTKGGNEIIKYPEGKKETEYKILVGVTNIKNSAFSNCTSLRSIEIPEGVTSIESYAFQYCTNLTSIEIPDSVTSIDNSAFEGCIVTKLTDANSDIELPNILKRTRDENDILYSSSGLNLTNCTIEDNKIKIIDINSYVMLEVKEGKLKGLKYKIMEDAWDISATENDNVIATLAYDGTLTISGTGNMRDWSYDDTTDWHGIKDDVKSVIIEQGITSIGHNAFMKCKSLTDIEIPNSVTIIGNYMFRSCESLTEIEIPNSVTSIGDRAFAGCKGLIEIEIPNSVTSIGYRAFEECKSLTDIEIPNSVTEIGTAVFSGCERLININVNEKNTKYRDENGVLYTKDGSRIIRYPEGKKETEYTILTTVTSIWEYAFYGCERLVNIEIPNSVTSIGYSAFEECKSLTDIEIPNSVTKIGTAVFSGCESLTTIDVDESNTNFMDNNGVLYTKDGTELIKYPVKKEGTEYIILNTVTNICKEAFYGCESLTKIELPDSVTTIEPSAFYGCENLTHIEFPDNLTSIGQSAFYGCKSLTDIKITYNVGSIGYNAFYGCEKLKILCYKGSYAEEYATTNNILFEILEKDNPGLEIIDIQFDDINLYNEIINGAINHTFSSGESGIDMSERILNKDDDKLTIQMEKKDIAFVNNIWIQNSEIQSINGIEKFYNLEQIWAKSNKISDIRPISNLTQLKVIDFEENQIDDISVLQNLEKLTTIYFGLNFKIESIDSLKNLANLNSVDLTANRICDISSITNLANLEELYLGINNIENISGIGNLTNLKTLVLSNNKIQDITELSKLTKLKALFLGKETTTPRNFYTDVNNYIIGNKIEDISPLRELVNLKTLGIDYNNINDISPIEELSLEKIYAESQELYFYTRIGESDSIEIDLPKVFIDSKDENSIAYTNKNFKLENCVLNEDATKIIVNSTKLNSGVSIQIDGGNLDETKLTIVNEKALKEIKITIPPSDTSYIEGQNFDKSGMEVTATYNDGNKKTVTNYTVIDGNNLTAGKTSVIISYTEDGVTKTTTQSITVTEKLKIELNTYEEKQEGNIKYIINIEPSLSVSEFTGKIETNGKIEVYKGIDKITNTNTKIGTGMKIKISLNDEQLEYTAVVTGDANGDGQSNIKDIMEINKHRLNKTMLEIQYLLAADVNEDANVDIKDIMKINKFRLGIIETF